MMRSEGNRTFRTGPSWADDWLIPLCIVNTTTTAFKTINWVQVFRIDEKEKGYISRAWLGSSDKSHLQIEPCNAQLPLCLLFVMLSQLSSDVQSVNITLLSFSSKFCWKFWMPIVCLPKVWILHRNWCKYKWNLYSPGLELIFHSTPSHSPLLFPKPIRRSPRIRRPVMFFLF